MNGSALVDFLRLDLRFYRPEADETVKAPVI